MMMMAMVRARDAAATGEPVAHITGAFSPDAAVSSTSAGGTEVHRGRSRWASRCAHMCTTVWTTSGRPVDDRPRAVDERPLSGDNQEMFVDNPVISKTPLDLGKRRVHDGVTPTGN